MLLELFIVIREFWKTLLEIENVSSYEAARKQYQGRSFDHLPVSQLKLMPQTPRAALLLRLWHSGAKKLQVLHCAVINVILHEPVHVFYLVLHLLCAKTPEKLTIDSQASSKSTTIKGSLASNTVTTPGVVAPIGNSLRKRTLP